MEYSDQSLHCKMAEFHKQFLARSKSLYTLEGGKVIQIQYKGSAESFKTEKLCDDFRENFWSKFWMFLHVVNT